MKTSFVLYTEYSKHINLLNIEQRGILFTAIMCHETGEELPQMDGMTAMAFSFIREQLERDKERYTDTCKKRSEAGKQGGRPKAKDECETEKADEKSKESKCFSEKANESNEKQSKAKKADNEDEDEDEYDISLLPPYIPPQSKSGRELQAFLRKYPNVTVDNCSTADLDVDFAAISAAFEGNDYLANEPHELSWVCKNARAIIAGRYKPKDRGGQGDFLKRLYAEAKAFDEGVASEKINGG